MYEPYLSRQITRFEREQMERAAAQRRLLAEHPDQIRPRQDGSVRRMLRRVLGGTNGRTAATRTTTACDATTVPAR